MAESIRRAADGLTGAYTGHDLGVKIYITTVLSITLYNALELVILIFTTFKKYKGLYFWSLLLSSSIGLVPYALGFLLKLFQLSALWLSLTLLTIGWYCMVTGQSVVLYSRLHLVMYDPRILDRVLALIIIDAIILHIPTTVLTYGSNLKPNNHEFISGFLVMEKIQMTGFCLQEFIISGIYIWETTKMLQLNSSPAKKRLLLELFLINSVISLMDVGLLVVEYLNLYVIEATLKGAIYSVKLKLEFAVLGRLTDFIQGRHGWDEITCDLPNSGYSGQTSDRQEPSC
ncbi:uncharacterized protein N7498_002077 [Penicillium cinerascens]|uniref:DUF7703 domain-containing protein n=1 Tax=Penicillium cinerascens TaxID=70096 RepID=A0A9W9N9C1_9EURO|nr:uncharacterized protein N7498_002077 [Penicillium cinerascens]KAJ5215670.1 hypothetical protein N7498_002077 [Penicillium cinerascens]